MLQLINTFWGIKGRKLLGSFKHNEFFPAQYPPPATNSKSSTGISSLKEILDLDFVGKAFALRAEPHLVHTLATVELLAQLHLLQITPVLDNKSSTPILKLGDRGVLFASDDRSEITYI